MTVSTLLHREQATGAIHGVACRTLTVNRDERGTFTEVFSGQWGLGIEPVQWNVVTSRPRTLRGMHLHFRHDEYFAVLKGRASVGLYDFRKESPTHGQSMMIELSDARLSCLTFPRGILHGWYFHDEGLHLQAVSEAYSSYGRDDNNGCLWSDPALGLDWPDAAPILSDRAASFPPLAELRRRVGQPD